jgi:hypothetical protein
MRMRQRTEFVSLGTAFLDRKLRCSKLIIIFIIFNLSGNESRCSCGMCLHPSKTCSRSAFSVCLNLLIGMSVVQQIPRQCGSCIAVLNQFWS